MKLKKIIVYDFDKTIYSGETGTDFFKFYIKKKPLDAFIFSCKYLIQLIMYMIKIINLKQLKERFFVFLEKYSVEEVDELVHEFWKYNKNKIYNWVNSELIDNKKNCDLVIVTSASPLFLIEKMILDIGFDYVFGTDFKKSENGYFVSIINGENNKGIEKVKKLNKWADSEGIDYKIVKFYSDSLADKPLYDLADKKIWIKKGQKIEGLPDKKTVIDKLFWK